jgi:hypothetical protein
MRLKDELLSTVVEGHYYSCRLRLAVLKIQEIGDTVVAWRV